MANWRKDGAYFLLGLTLALAFFGVVVAIGGLLLLLVSVLLPASLEDAFEAISRPLQIGLLIVALLEVIIWNLIPLAGFTSQRLARRIALIMAAIMLFLTISLLFSL